MKKVQLLLLSFVIFSLSYGQSEWVNFKSEKEGYKISFPAKPEEQSQTIPSDAGELKMNMMIYDASKQDDDNMVYLFNYTDYPDSLMRDADEETLKNFFEGTVAGAAKNVKGKVLSQKDIKLKNYIGVEGRIDYMDGKAIITMRCYLKANRLFMLETITAPDKENNTNFKKFVDSFEIL